MASSRLRVRPTRRGSLRSPATYELLLFGLFRFARNDADFFFALYAFFAVKFLLVDGASLIHPTIFAPSRENVFSDS